MHEHMNTARNTGAVHARWSDDAHGLSTIDGHVQPQDVAAPFRHLISLKIIIPSGEALVVTNMYKLIMSHGW